MPEMAMSPMNHRSQYTQQYKYTHNPTSLTQFLKTMLWISLSITIFSLLVNYIQINRLDYRVSSSTVEAFNATISLQRFISILSMVTFIITSIAFLKWIHLANKNCYGFGAQDMEFTPGWSIGYYFVPFLNLYKPYQAMKEIWKVSTNPANWHNETGSALLGWWWALWLISNYFWLNSFSLFMKANKLNHMGAWYVYAFGEIISGVLDIPLYIVALSLITAIHNKQERLERLVEKNV